MEKDRAVNGQDVLLFLDTSHFVMGCEFLGAVYGRVRRFVKTFSRRQRYNALGAIKTTTLTKKTIGSKAFTGINIKAVIKCPKGKKATYKKILLKKGMKKTMKFK